MSEFCMPSLGADMEYGTLVEWKVKAGDRVKRGDVVAVVETVKGAIDIEIFASGTVEKLLVEPGAKVPVGAPMALIAGEADQTGPSAPLLDAEPRPAAAPAQPLAGERLRVSPVARKMAAELGLDVSTVKGSGPQGAVTRADIEAAAAAAAAASAPSAAPPAPRSMRDVIGAAMVRSKREAPHYYLSTRIDFGRAMEWLRARNLDRPVTARLLPAVLLLKATALATREVPEVNGTWASGRFHPSDKVHLGVAISLRQGGLIAPAIHDAGTQTLDALMVQLLDLVTRARGGGLRSSELSDPTITVTNLGDLGVESVLAVIYPPQVAIVGFGRIAPQPWVRGEKVEARPVLTASLSADHRVSDGHRGGLFLSAIDRLLQEPERL